MKKTKLNIYIYTKDRGKCSLNPICSVGIFKSQRLGRTRIDGQQGNKVKPGRHRDA